MECKNKQIVVLLLTDKSTDEICYLYNELFDSLSNIAHIYVAYHQKTESIPASIAAMNHFIFDNSILKDFGYYPIEETLVPGSNHFPLLKFYIQNKTYDYYCIIEDDVRFTGDWKKLFQMLFDFNADLLSCCIRHWREEPNWYWWNTLKHRHLSIKNNNLIASFNPIYGISNRALLYIDNCLRQGWKGHHEVLLPSLLNDGGYKLVDFGGDGAFVPKGYENKFYFSMYTKTLSNFIPTMRYRPIMKEVGNIENKLFHPVKCFHRE